MFAFFFEVPEVQLSESLDVHAASFILVDHSLFVFKGIIEVDRVDLWSFWGSDAEFVDLFESGSVEDVLELAA